jgi:ubiquitin carboxyl-terminal hydrolase 48
VTVESGKARQQEMAKLYNMLPVTEDAPYEFITTDWLVKWLSGDDVQPVDNSPIVCPHGKLNPNSLPQTKCISFVAISVLEIYETCLLDFYFSPKELNCCEV